MAKTSKSNKYVYTWGNKKADGDGSMKPLLGGKGANLAEMTRLGMRACIVTNGTLLDRERARRLHQAGMRTSSVSIEPPSLCRSASLASCSLTVRSSSGIRPKLR